MVVLLPFHCSYLLPWQAQICLQGKSCECRDFNSLSSGVCDLTSACSCTKQDPLLTMFLQAFSSPLLHRRVLSLELTDGFVIFVSVMGKKTQTIVMCTNAAYTLTCPPLGRLNEVGEWAKIFLTTWPAVSSSICVGAVTG